MCSRDSEELREPDGAEGEVWRRQRQRAVGAERARYQTDLQGQASVLLDPPDPLDIGDQGQRVFEPSMTAHIEAETGMSFFITKAQKLHCDASVIARNRSGR